MYFPYLRGRQYELLALRELVSKNLLDYHIIPIVEPIKLTATFDSTLKAFKDAGLPIAIIFNPAVGDLASMPDVTTQLLPYLENNTCIIPSVLMNRNAENALTEMEDRSDITNDKILAILNDHDSLDIYKKLFANVVPQFTLFRDERQIRRTVNKNKVLFEDRFNKQKRNEDYSNYEDEFFSEDHLFYNEEGYIGFGDYSIIGDEFTEGGFAPKAVAIHIVYFADNNSLRIRHLVSDTNIDISDTAGKCHEAITKLVHWYQDELQTQETSALTIFLDYYQKGGFPGLPILKKLSIMHHLELMGKYLSGGWNK
jgi:hypothetical protein